MKPLLTAALLALVAVPSLAQSVDISGVFGPSTYPEPAPETVTQDDILTEN